MEFRLATISDLPELEIMYKNIVQQMNLDHLEIWDDIYPCDFLGKDIEAENFYVMLNTEEIVGGFALLPNDNGISGIQWTASDKVMYLERLGVNVKWTHKGCATMLIKKAQAVAYQNGAEYLRLIVSDINTPAINLYSKNNFKRAPGVYTQIIEDGPTLKELGMEIKLIK